MSNKSISSQIIPFTRLVLFVLCISSLVWMAALAEQAHADAAEKGDAAPVAVIDIGKVFGPAEIHASQVFTDAYELNDVSPGFSVGTTYGPGISCATPVVIVANASLYKFAGIDLDFFNLSVAGNVVYTISIVPQTPNAVAPINFNLVIQNQGGAQVATATSNAPIVSLFAPTVGSSPEGGNYRIFIQAQNPSFDPRDQTYNIMFCSSPTLIAPPSPYTYMPLLINSSPVVSAPPLGCNTNTVGVLATHTELDRQDEIVLFGELCNPTTRAIGRIQYAFEAVGPLGQVLETKALTEYRYMPAGQRMCFRQFLAVKPVGAVYYQYRVIGYDVIDTAFANLSLEDIALESTNRAVVGRAVNETGSAAYIDHIELVAYSDDGHVIDCDPVSNVNSQSIIAGQATSFRASLGFANLTALQIGSRFSRYSVQVVAQRS